MRRSQTIYQSNARILDGDELNLTAKIPLLILLTLSAGCAVENRDHELGSSCSGISVQVLGSGGPIADDGRASSSYLVWVNGRSRFLIDVGGGSFLRFGEANAKFSDLEFIGISHMHTDHSVDLPALLKSGYFSNRSRPLVLAGPSGNARFPGLLDFAEDLFAGAYGYLGGYLSGDAGLPKLELVETNIEGRTEVVVFSEAEHQIQVRALSVPHGVVPAIAFRVIVGDQSVVFAGDQNGSDKRFVEFATGTDLLVLHMPIPQTATGGAVQLHARPSRLGEMAQSIAPDRLVISHLMARSIRDLDENLDHVQEHYTGRLDVAHDLRCYDLDGS